MRALLIILIVFFVFLATARDSFALEVKRTSQTHTNLKNSTKPDTCSKCYFEQAFLKEIFDWGQKPAVKENVFKTMAGELISGIDSNQNNQGICPQSIIHDKFSKNLCRSGKKLRVAILPFNEETVPISMKIASDFNNRLLRKLIVQGNDRYEFLARAELPSLINESDAWSGIIDKPIINLLKRVANVDVLIIGTLMLEKSDALLSYKAVSSSGNILALTRERAIYLSKAETKANKPEVSLEQAITLATQDLRENANDMTALVVDKIVYQNSDFETEFGRYLKDRMTIALQGSYANVLTTRKLKIFRFGEKLSVGKDIPYILRGTYWLLPNSIEIRINLRNQMDEVVSWKGWIRKDTIEEIGQNLFPKGSFGTLRDNDGLGPFNFHLTSDRGANPIYRVGDKLRVKISLKKDAWVYCFNLANDGRLYWLFPNSHHPKAHLKGGSSHGIPGDLFPYKIEVQGPPGHELIKCFAVSRDVATDLPKELRGFDPIYPLPKQMLRTLSPIFQQLPDASVSEASIAVTIE